MRLIQWKGDLEIHTFGSGQAMFRKAQFSYINLLLGADLDHATLLVARKVDRVRRNLNSERFIGKTRRFNSCRKLQNHFADLLTSKSNLQPNDSNSGTLAQGILSPSHRAMPQPEEQMIKSH
jgi:hypothetical protein